MRDPARIEPVLRQLRDFWLAHPDLRLGQLIAWVGGDNLFQIEDDEMTARLADLARTATCTLVPEPERLGAVHPCPDDGVHVK